MELNPKHRYIYRALLWIFDIAGHFVQSSGAYPSTKLTIFSLLPPCCVKHRVLFDNTWEIMLNTLRPRHNGRHFADDIVKCFFLNQNVWIPIKFSLKFVPKGLINYIPALVQIMAWRRPGDKPLFEPMMISLLTHICVSRPQWVKVCISYFILGTELRL